MWVSNLPLVTSSYLEFEMTRALTVSILTVVATIAAALLVTPTAQARVAGPQLQDVETRIEAQVDARLHTILDGFLQQAE